MILVILYSIFSYLVCSVGKFQIIATSSILIPLNNINCTLKSYFRWARVHDFLVIQKTAWLFSPSINLSLSTRFCFYKNQIFLAPAGCSYFYPEIKAAIVLNLFLFYTILFLWILLIYISLLTSINFADFKLWNGLMDVVLAF